MYATDRQTDVRQRDVRHKHRCGGGGIIIPSCTAMSRTEPEMEMDDEAYSGGDDEGLYTYRAVEVIFLN